MTAAPSSSRVQPSGPRRPLSGTLRTSRPAGRPILGEGDGEDDQEEDLRGGAGIAQFPAAEGGLEQEQDGGARAAARAAGSEQLGLTEQLQLRGGLQHDDE